MHLVQTILCKPWGLVPLQAPPTIRWGTYTHQQCCQQEILVEYRGAAFLIGTGLHLGWHMITHTSMHRFISPIFSCAGPNAVQHHHGVPRPSLAILEGIARSKVQGLLVPNGKHWPALMGMLRLDLKGSCQPPKQVLEQLARQ